VSVYADGAERDALINNPKYASDPVIIRFLAKVGADLKEDTVPNDAGGVALESAKEMMQTEAYQNPKHPEHKATVQKVAQAYGFK